ncbi:phosphoenolpyruvate--protein phosphotransferase [Desulfococcus sp.]|uniref:phosphoenolpyruvate--protein phosphotransferase n=1 Tax=Desulfococcus sp. TaxID=2025834 RepID=UPI00359462F2
MTEPESQEIVLKGLGVAPGICIGKAYLVDKEGVNVVKKYTVAESEIQKEENRFKAAVGKARQELRVIIQETPKELRQHIAILETHIVLLQDKMLYGRTIDTIHRFRYNAEWALKNVVDELKAMFQNMSEPYFRERGADIGHVSDRIMRNLVGVEAVNIKDIDKRVILVARDLSPAETSQIQLERIKGLVTDGGGIASHTGIIARTLDIPAVLGLNNASQIIKNDDFIVVDGQAGLLIIHPTEQTLMEYEERSIRYERHKALIARESRMPAKTVDGVAIQVMGNIELPEEVVAVRDHGGNGIGLYRTEFQYMGRRGFPTEDELFDKYRDVVEVMSPRPVTIRTLDINGDKALPNQPATDEANPVLGLRAIRYCLKKPEIFKTQLRAILRAALYGNVRIMFPMISSCEEVRQAKALLKEAADALAAEGTEFEYNVDVGIMIEVPSAVTIADMLAPEVDFFSIGTNDLIQYALAIDRSNRYVSHMYQPLHPAIIRMIRTVVDVGHQKGIKVFMCGEMAGDPIYLPVLLGLGLDELSMNAQSIPLVKNAIRKLSLKESRAFMYRVFKEKMESHVEAMLKSAYAGVLFDLDFEEDVAV